ncbi:MAG TPA: alpha/beta hydrolase [Herbaspirillum sp.]|jgi:esterase
MNGYRQAGHGPIKVIVLSGWFGSSDDWTALEPSLDFDRFTYVFFDYRGYGRSQQIEGRYDFSETAEDVLRLADHLQWHRFSLIGHSMGGMAMQRVMLADPGRIESMIAITAVSAAGSGMPDERLALFRRAVDDPATRESILDASTGKRLTKQWVRHMSQQSLANALPIAFGRYLSEWSRGDFSILVKGCPIPLKVIVGEHDPSLSANAMQQTWLAWYPNSELEIMTNAGHYPMHEAPPALAASIQNFLLKTADPIS